MKSEIKSPVFDPSIPIPIRIFSYEQKRSPGYIHIYLDGFHFTLNEMKSVVLNLQKSFQVINVNTILVSSLDNRTCIRLKEDSSDK